MKKNPCIKIQFGDINRQIIPTVFHINAENQIGIYNRDPQIYLRSNPFIKFTKIIENNLPRIALLNNPVLKQKLLGSLVQNNYVTNDTEKQIINSVFKRFSDCWLDVVSEIFDWKYYLKDKKIKHQHFYDGNPYFEANLDSHYIYDTLVLRVSVLSMMLEICRDKEVNFQLHKFISTHIKLYNFTIQNNVHAFDGILMRNNLPNRVEPVFVTLYPNDIDFKDPNEFMDMGEFYFGSNKSDNDNPKKPSSSLVNLISHYVFKKTALHTCQRRKFREKIQEEIKKNQKFKECIKRIISLSFCGDYETANIKLSFVNRAKIQRLFWETEEKDEQAFDVSDFIQNHEYLTMFMFREFVLFNIQSDQSYHNFFKSNEKNVQYEEFTTISMDCFRKIFEECLDSGFAINSPEFSQRVLSLEFKCNAIFLTYKTKTEKHPPAIVWYKKMESMSRKKNIADPSDVLTATEKSKIAATVLYVKMMGDIHFKCFFDLERLKPLGISPRAFYYFRYIFLEYCNSDAADNPIVDQLTIIYERDPKCFAIIRYYLRRMIFHYSYLRYATDVNSFIKQEYGFIRKMTDCEDVNITRYSYYCSNCQRWANHVIRPGDITAKKKMGAFTPSECALQITTNNLVCIRSKDTNQTKKYDPEEEDDDEDDDDQDKMQVDEVDVNTLKVNGRKCCSNSQLIRVKMNGCFQKICSRIYYNCWICNCIIEYKPSNVGINGITCRHHSKKILNQQLERKISLQIPCEFCGNNIYSKVYNGQRGDMIRVFDDTKKDSSGNIMPRIRKIGLCYQHFNHFSDINHHSFDLPKLSDLLNKLGEIMQKKFRLNFRRRF